jgi:hypothetical protein
MKAQIVPDSRGLSPGMTVTETSTAAAAAPGAARLAQAASAVTSAAALAFEVLGGEPVLRPLPRLHAMLGIEESA